MLLRDQTLQKGVSGLIARNRPWTSSSNSLYKCVLGSGTENSIDVPQRGARLESQGGHVSQRASETLTYALFLLLLSLLIWTLTLSTTLPLFFLSSIQAVTLVFGLSLFPHPGFRSCGLGPNRDAWENMEGRQEEVHRIQALARPIE